MEFKSLKKANLSQKRVLVRVDFNVPINKGQVADDFRIQKTLPLINYLKRHKVKRIILISHLGQPKNSKQKKFSLKPIALFLEKILKEKVYFFPEKIGSSVLENKLDKLNQGEICLLENIRYYPAEEANDDNFAKKLASLADIYINEAFSASHRKSASLVAITKYLPSYPGFLFEEEIKNLNRFLKSKKRPIVIILGGAKIKDKLPLMEKFLPSADYVLVGGVMANTILKARNFEIGKSIYEKEVISEAKSINPQKGKLILPDDFKVLSRGKVESRKLEEIKPADIIFDIGQNSADFYEKIILQAKTIFWNGPMGKIEEPEFSLGTEKIKKTILKNKKALTVIGGGDTISIFQGRLPKRNNLFFSTGGGATLAYLSGQNLAGVVALRAK